MLMETVMVLALLQGPHPSAQEAATVPPAEERSPAVRVPKPTVPDSAAASEAKTKLPDTPQPRGFTKWLETAEQLFKLLAYVVGGAWVYFNSFKGRTYRPRLEASVTGALCRRMDPEFIRGVVSLKNVGLDKVDICKKGTGLRVLVFDQNAPTKWRHVETIPIFEHHQWIEPGETINDHFLLPLDLKEVAAARLEVIITGRRTMWEACAIVS